MDFKNAPKIVSKSSQNRPWGVPGGSLGVPRDLPEASREPSGWFMRRGENLRKIWSVPGTSRSPFWSPAGTPKSTKNWLVAQKGAPGNAFLSIFVANVVFLDFLVDFWLILHETIMKNDQKSTEKSRKTTSATKIDKKRSLEHPCAQKVDFW